jgi:hypothetical protein
MCHSFIPITYDLLRRMRLLNVRESSRLGDHLPLTLDASTTAVEEVAA